MNRRGLLLGILAAATAPAIARSGVLMPVRQIIVPEPRIARLGGIDWSSQSDETVLGMFGGRPIEPYRWIVVGGGSWRYADSDYVRECQ